MDLTGVTWRKSSYSGNNGGNCAELAHDPLGAVVMRDSKDPLGPFLVFTADQWREFAAAVKTGDFDLG